MTARHYRYIAVEGAIGVGKTTLSRMLAHHFGARLVLEEPRANPFLGGFYQDMDRFAFPAQMSFLAQRVGQLREVADDLDAGRPVVADFLLDKDDLFARLTLADDEYALYRQFFDLLAPPQPAPDLVIYLQASLDALIARVKRRGEAIERDISEDYLRELDAEYTRFFHEYDSAPLLIVNSEHLNFADRPQDFDLLLRRIMDLRSNREFFNRG
jgi:deoxyguanosine kinase